MLTSPPTYYNRESYTSDGCRNPSSASYESWYGFANASVRVSTPPNKGEVSLSSYHNGGAQLLLADGSAHFVSESVDGKTMFELSRHNLAVSSNPF